jgi:hypothetical protein
MRYTEIHNRSVFGMDIVDDGRSAISHSMDRTVSWSLHSAAYFFSTVAYLYY